MSYFKNSFEYLKDQEKSTNIAKILVRLIKWITEVLIVWSSVNCFISLEHIIIVISSFLGLEILPWTVQSYRFLNYQATAFLLGFWIISY